jgi:uncharacterized protein YndB with AHSA1/START domain
MGDAAFELQRTIKAPIGEVFARLADIEGHNQWMPGKASILKGTKQTSPGPVGLGTSYEDSTKFGTTPGEIVVFEPPRRLLHHWWDKTSSGRTKFEGWPGYTLEPAGDGETFVRHDAKLRTYGIYNLATPVLVMIAKKERTAVLDALEKSFD